MKFWEGTAPWNADSGKYRERAPSMRSNKKLRTTKPRSRRSRGSGTRSSSKVKWPEVRKQELQRRCRIESANCLQSSCDQKPGSTPTGNSSDERRKQQEKANSRRRRKQRSMKTSQRSRQGSNKNETRKPTEATTREQNKHRSRRAKQEQQQASTKRKSTKQKTSLAVWVHVTGPLRCSVYKECVLYEFRSGFDVGNVAGGPELFQGSTWGTVVARGRCWRGSQKPPVDTSTKAIKRALQKKKQP